MEDVLVYSRGIYKGADCNVILRKDNILIDGVNKENFLNSSLTILDFEKSSIFMYGYIKLKDSDKNNIIEIFFPYKQNNQFSEIKNILNNNGEYYKDETSLKIKTWGCLLSFIGFLLIFFFLFYINHWFNSTF